MATLQASLNTSSSIKKPRKPYKKRARKTNNQKSGPDENLAAVYFKDVATLPVLKKNEEFHMAQCIESLEVELWTTLLSHPGLAGTMLEIIPSEELGGVKRLLQAAKNARAQRTAAARNRFEEQCSELAEQIRQKDLDRITLDNVLEELDSFARGRGNMRTSRPIRVNVRSKSFGEYYKNVKALARSSQQARNRLVKANLRLVVAIVNRYKFGRLPFTDLIQEGNLGLIKAVGRYDYRRGCRFSTYAGWWIRHSITRAIADKGRMVRVPVHVLDSHHKMDQATWQLSNRLGRQPTNEEISSTTKITKEKVKRLRAYPPNHAFSLDNSLSDDDSRSFLELMQNPDSPLPSDRVQDLQVLEHVRQIFWELKPIEADILRRRFGLHDGRIYSLKDIGKDYTLSRERIRQIQEQALGKIRKALTRRKAI